MNKVIKLKGMDVKDPLYKCPTRISIKNEIPSPVSMRRQFHSLCEQNSDPQIKAKKLSKNNNSIRIATFNVHYWTNLYEKSSVDLLMSDLSELDAEILCLQEVSFDKTKYNKYSYDELMSKFNQMGYKDSIEVRSSFYLGAHYGNLILSKYVISDKMMGYLYKGSTKVRRGYCIGKIKELNLSVCCVHLDVFDESGQTRERQIMELLKVANAPQNNLLICGDFNSIRKDDYNDHEYDLIIRCDQARNATTDIHTLKHLSDLGYRSSFDSINQKSPNCTVWSCRAIDFIFVPPDFIGKIQKSEIYYTINSDHYAVYLDLEK